MRNISLTDLLSIIGYSGLIVLLPGYLFIFAKRVVHRSNADLAGYLAFLACLLFMQIYVAFGALLGFIPGQTTAFTVDYQTLIPPAAFLFLTLLSGVIYGFLTRKKV